MNHQTQILQREIRHLRNVIDRMGQEKLQGDFIEKLQCAALSGFCAQPWITDKELHYDVEEETGKGKNKKMKVVVKYETGIERAVRLSAIACNTAIKNIMEAVNESIKQEAEETGKTAEEITDVINNPQDGKSGLII